ncbi:RagB/SusD family nutrient uptake outer membrane protein [Flavihumibacter sp. CACIAM 22H1]|uniref:RagB/SusD family nutrient uptake outer membrane protein n=1 Tax=Flavihumibacter sp. CACIAM 22H1 TaxID=1812911 RepID=UPI000AA79B78|nr:RagB/SusD family nutrient uptake outer membrane protein [Flavihumibacter sp. CACIAM 22H1]
MKRIQLNSLLAACIITLLSGCSKEYLEKKPYNALPVDQAIKTEADLLIAVRGTYAGLRNLDLYGRTMPLLGDLMGDNTYQSVTNSNRYTLYNQYAMSVADGNALNMWTAAYNVILRANNIINANLEETAAIKSYKGEAYAIRGLMYFELLRFFSKPYAESTTANGVPVVLAFNPTDKPSRKSVAEVYTQVLSDLGQAYSLLGAYSNSSRISKYAAKAIEARVLLTKGDKAAALTAALEVINSNEFTLTDESNHVAYWRNPAPLTNKLETLFEVSSDGVSNLSFDALGYIYNQNGYGDFLCADDLYALFADTDVRKLLLEEGTRGGAPGVFVKKYTNITTDRDDTKVIRLSEVYLIAAEASLATDEVAARDFLNAVATRRDPDFAGYTSTGAALLEDILTERRKELAFEGQRFHDLNRLKRPIVRSTNFPAAARNIPYPFDKRLLPIPQSEQDANPNIAPNPGY